MSDAPVVSLENGHPIYRASSLGMCERALIAARMGMTSAAPPQWLQAKFQQGHDLEGQILSAVGDLLGAKVTAAQDPISLPVGTLATIRGHIDGRVGNNSPSPEPAGVEAKALGKSLLADWLRGPGHFFSTHPGYAAQLTVYMAGTGLPFWYAVWDKGNDQLHLELIDRYPADLDAIKKKIVEVEMAGRQGQLPRECVAPSFPCPFYYLPGHDSKSAQPDNTDTFSVLAQEACEAREDKKRAEERAKNANAQLLEYLQEKGEDKLECEGYVANRVSSKSTSFDRDQMKADGVYDRYLKERQYEYAKASRKE